MTGPCAVIIFSIAKHLFNLTVFQIASDAHRADKGCAHDALVLKRKLQQQGDALVGAPLVLSRDIEKNVVPAVSPVVGQVSGNTLRPFGQEKEFHISAPAHDFPCLIPPGIRLFQKKVRGHADADHFTAPDLIISFPILLKGIMKVCFCSVYVRAAFIPHTIQKEHIAVVAALAFFPASVPWVPDIVQSNHPDFLILFSTQYNFFAIKNQGAAPSMQLQLLFYILRQKIDKRRVVQRL